MDTNERSRALIPSEITEVSTSTSILDSMINTIPFELHLPGYHFLGPGTHLEERLARGDCGVNPLDQACLEHDIAYSQRRNQNRPKADRVLAERAFSRMLTETADCEEKAAALVTVFCMVGKIAFDKFYRSVKKTIRRRIKKKRHLVPTKSSNGEDAQT